MNGPKRIRDYGLTIGTMPTGLRNTITDVDGVKVGHVTLDDHEVKTGVTAVLPHTGNLFQEKLLAAAHVINGFGKSMGLIQIRELGLIETPIVLTNTLSIGEAGSALIDYMLEANEDIGRTTGTVNPVVCECNDAHLNDIRGKHVQKAHAIEAIANADVTFEEGAVGAGTGMSCYELKGGIGSASRKIRIEDEEYTLGALVLTNMGLIKDLTIDGRPLGRDIARQESFIESLPDAGSIIVILAADVPLTAGQLERVCKRAVVGVNRTGSHTDHGSGEIVVAFTTAQRVPHYYQETFVSIQMLHDDFIDLVFRAAIESTEEAVLNSMISAGHTVGRDGHIRRSLKEYINILE